MENEQQKQNLPMENEQQKQTINYHHSPILHSAFDSCVSVLGRGMNYNILSVKDIEKCPGFGFFPTEECLLDFYLVRKNSGKAKESWPILEIDLCAFEPSDLVGLPTAGCDDYKYFYNRRQYADDRNKSYKRRTKTGYWKSTGNPREIKRGSTKRSLVFYLKEAIRGSKAVRTGYIIQEYDIGGEYVIAKLQIKNDKNKKSKSRRRQNVLTDDFMEDNQIVHRNIEVQNFSTDVSVEDNQIVHRNTEVQNFSTNFSVEDNQIVYRNTEVQKVSTDDSAENNQIVYRNSEVQKVSTDVFVEDNQIVYRNTQVQNIYTDGSVEDMQTDSHDSEDLSGFEDQNQEEMMVMVDHNQGETACLIASVYNRNFYSTDSGYQYQSLATSSDLENYNPNKKTADYAASGDEVQNGKNMNTILTYSTSKAICQEVFSYETENQFSTNQSEVEWSSMAAPPFSNFPNEATYNGESMTFYPYLDWSLYPVPAASNLEDQSDWLF